MLLNYILHIFLICNSERDVVVEVVLIEGWAAEAAGVVLWRHGFVRRGRLWAVTAAAWRAVVLVVAAAVVLVVTAALLAIAAAVAAVAGVVAAAIAAEAAFAAAAAVQHLDVVGDDFGGVALLAALVGPFAGLQAAFDVEFAAFARVLANDFGGAAVGDDAVPFGFFAFFAGVFVVPGLTGGDGDVGHRFAVGHVAHVRVVAQVADEYDFVDACHFGCFLVCSGKCAGSGLLCAA